MPEGVKSIGSRAFSDCPFLWGIYLPSSLEEIGEAAFEGVCEDLVILGEEGSFAEDYAKQKGYSFRKDGGQ